MFPSTLRRLFALLISVTLLVALTACSPSDSTKEASSSPGENGALSAVVPSPPSGFPRTIIDGTGVAITLEAPPERIFSGAVAIDNILLSIVDPQRVAAVTQFAADPVYSYVTDRVEDHMLLIDALNPEFAVAANPDIVLVASWNDADAVRQIRDLGYNVYTFTAFGDIDDALENIARIGEILGEEEAAQRLIDGFYAEYGRIAAAISGRERPRVLYWNDWGSTAGSDTAVDGVIRYAGGINLAAEHGIEGWHLVDDEWILAMDPDVIITDAYHEFQARLEDHPALSTLTAVRTGRVYFIDHLGALNHHFIRAIDQLARLLHPDAFTD